MAPLASAVREAAAWDAELSSNYPRTAKADSPIASSTPSQGFLTEAIPSALRSWTAPAMFMGPRRTAAKEIVALFTVFPQPPGGEYKETILHSFNKFNKRNDDGCNPESYPVSDPAGSLYGTTNKGGGGGVNNTFCVNGCGSVFKLAPNGDGTCKLLNIFDLWWPGTELNRRRQPFQGYDQRA